MLRFFITLCCENFYSLKMIKTKKKKKTKNHKKKMKEQSEEERIGLLTAGLKWLLAGWLIVYSVHVSVCLCVIKFCKQDVSKTDL